MPGRGASRGGRARTARGAGRRERLRQQRQHADEVDDLVEQLQAARKQVSELKTTSGRAQAQARVAQRKVEKALLQAAKAAEEAADGSGDGGGDGYGGYRQAAPGLLTGGVARGGHPNSGLKPKHARYPAREEYLASCEQRQRDLLQKQAADAQAQARAAPSPDRRARAAPRARAALCWPSPRQMRRARDLRCDFCEESWWYTFTYVAEYTNPQLTQFNSREFENNL